MSVVDRKEIRFKSYTDCKCTWNLVIHDNKGQVGQEPSSSYTPKKPYYTKNQ